MKNIFLLVLLFLSTSFQGSQIYAAISNAPAKPICIGQDVDAHAFDKNFKKQKKARKAHRLFSAKNEEKMAKWQKKGKWGASLRLGNIGLIVVALGGLFILLGLLIPYVGILFLVIGIIIAFVGLILMLLLDGVKVQAGDSSR